MSGPDKLRVLIASYDEPGPANSDYEAVKRLYDEVETRNTRTRPATARCMGHINGGLDDDDLRGITDTLERGKAALIVVHAADIADQIAARVKASDTYVSKDVQARVEQLATQMREADLAR